jgi:hypothetical protein
MVFNTLTIISVYYCSLKFVPIKGFVVFAGCLDAAGAKQLVKDGGNNLVTVQLNVTSEEDVNRALQYVSDVLRERQICG